MADLFYAVIALKNSDIDEVVAKLNAQKLDAIAQWLTQKKGLFYGKRNEDWKPFNGRTIYQLVNETKGYQTQTNLIEALDEQANNISIVRKSPIKVYFIDVFALFVDKYVNLANKVDFHVADCGQCCLLMSYELPRDMQDQLIGTYCSVWKEVCNTYREGNLHRIAMRIDDLRNFRNYLLKLFGPVDAPTPVADRELDGR